MVALRILDKLNELGIKVEVQGGRLGLSPKSKLTPSLLKEIRQHKEEIIKLLQRSKPQPQDSIWQETNSLFHASLLRVKKCYIPGVIEKALKRDEVCSAFEMLDKVWKDVLEGKEDIASFKRALEQWETTLLFSLKEFI